MTRHLGLFEGFGVEMEYMIVDRKTLSVRPLAGHVLRDAEGVIHSEVEHGAIAWSNELVLHVVELKTNGPAREFRGLAAKFQESVAAIDEMLASVDCRLMPAAMHPWMKPDTEMKLWPHEYSPVYEAYNRIFDCRGHGWSNLQSTHINLPFATDEEFGRLHAAIRLVLPLLPALAASSPVFESRLAANMDQRLEVYRHNSKKIPSIAGCVIPERAFTEADYHEKIFAPMFREIAPHDPDGVLQDEFLNSRGAIARFGRGTIEIRVIDIQECPAADIAVVELTIALVRALAEGRLSPLAEQRTPPESDLAAIFLRCVRDAGDARIDEPWFLAMFGESSPASAQELWNRIAARVLPHGATDPKVDAALKVLLEKGCLAKRLRGALAGDVSKESLFATWSRLCDCLAKGEPFRG